MERVNDSRAGRRVALLLDLSKEETKTSLFDVPLKRIDFFVQMLSEETLVPTLSLSAAASLKFPYHSLHSDAPTNMQKISHQRQGLRPKVMLNQRGGFWVHRPNRMLRIV